jgi:hypothetical protein
MTVSSTVEIRSNGVKLVHNDFEGAAPERWLVVGDGDLSYSASIADELASLNIQLIASVLEPQDEHNRVYERSKENSDTIAESSHHVQFGVDATRLPSHFPDAMFDCIEFNFPHWRGKTNNRYNRQLVDNFLSSASKVLKPSGEIRISLCEGQGGMPGTTIEDWRRSWMPAMYAAEHNLLLKRIEPYQPSYGLSSHRGLDRPFWIGDTPQKYVFTLPDGEPAERDAQLSCRHELRIMLHPERLQQSPVSREDIVDGDAVYQIAKEFVPEGIRFELPARDLLTPQGTKSWHVPLAVFLLNYTGETNPLTRSQSDEIRSNIEAAIQERWKLEIAKAGRMVSKPYPYIILSSLIKEYSHSSTRRRDLESSDDDESI